MPRKKRFRILLDEMMAPREKYPLINSRHDIKHIVHDFHQKSAQDIEIIQLAKEENRIIITENIRHFEESCKLYGVDMIGVTASMLPEILDKQINAKLNHRKTEKMEGKTEKIVNPPRRRSNG